MRPRFSPAILFAIGLVLSGAPAHAQSDDRCSGTLCDLYYGNKPKSPQPAANPQQAPAGAQQLTVPTGGFLSRFFGGGQQPAQGTAGGQAQEQHSLIGGGGIAGMVRGDTPDRCTGTLCDLYYGGPPKEKPAQAAAQAPATTQAATQAHATTQAAATGSYNAEPLPAPDAPDAVMRAPVRKCVATPADPWKCYK